MPAPEELVVPRRNAIRSEYELLRLARLSSQWDAATVELVTWAAESWVDGGLPELTPQDTAFLVEALFKCGRLSRAAQVAQLRASLGGAASAFDDLATQYQRLAGYDFALSHARLPRMFPRRAAEGPPRVLSVYHSCITFQTSGYTVRTQAILSNSALDVVPMTRIGYPWAAKLAKATLAKVDKQKFETTSGKVKYVHRRGQVGSQSQTFSNIALGKHEIMKSICEHEPDVVHAASNFVNALPALLAARASGLPFVYEMRGLWELTAGVGIPFWLESERYRLERRIETFVASHADRVIVLSEVQRRELIDRGVDAEKIEVVVNGHEPSLSSRADRMARLREQCPNLIDWIGGRTVIGYAGAIAVYEGLQDLIAVFAEHRRTWDHVALVVAGDGPYLEELRSQVAALGLEGSIKLLGRVPGEVAEALYEVVDLCVLPRLPDLVSQLITPLKTVEILCHGKVLLASNVGAIAEQLSRYGFGETFVAGSREDLGRQLARVLSDLPRLKARYQAAPARIEDSFSWASIARDWDRVLADVAAPATEASTDNAASAAVAPLYDERPERFPEPLPLWRRVARAHVRFAAENPLYLSVPRDYLGDVRLVAMAEDGEVGHDVVLGPPRVEETVVLRELLLPLPGQYVLFAYLEREKAHAAPQPLRLLSGSPPGVSKKVQELRPGLKPEMRDTLAFEIDHQVKSATQLSLSSEYPGAMRVALSYVPLAGASLNDNFVQRTKSKVTGTRFHYVSIAPGSSEMALFPRATGRVLVEMTPWGDGEILENRLRYVARISYAERDGAYFPSLDRSRTNVLVAANINETLLDGSTIWLKTLANTLADAPNVNVFVATNAIHVSNGVTAELFAKRNVAKIDLVSSKTGSERISDLAQQIQLIDRTSGGFDLIVVRGLDFAEEIVSKATRDRVVYYGAGMFRRDDSGTLVTDEAALRVASKCSGVIFQNGVMAELFRQRRPDFDGTCYEISPCVEDGALERARSLSVLAPTPGEKLVVYAGKLIREYGLLELLQAVRHRIDAGYPTRLVILGNKFDGRDRDYQKHFEVAVEGLGGAVTWLPAVPPITALAWVLRADAVWGWRHGQFENSHFEVSTKMVEAICAGTPIVLYPAAANVALMGGGYAGFAEGASDAARALARLLDEGKPPFARLSIGLKDRFHAGIVYTPLLRRFNESSRPRGSLSLLRASRPAILVAAHDFRFFEDIESSFLRRGHAVTREYWRSHTGRFVHGQAAAVERADVIFCEWCLGNAAWWSQNLPPGKRLLIRFHLQELHTSHPAEVDYTRVEKVIFISPYVMREAIAKFGIPPEKCQVIPISVRLKATRSTPSELRTRRDVLAMVGLTPWRKRPNRALELLSQLRDRYPNLTLHIKGHTPSDYAWMGNRREELGRYQSLFKEMLTLERQGIVRMSGYDDELEAFYGGVGWVLSLSDFEGCHTAVAEGGAMGCLPLMTSWAGADEVYPRHLVQQDLAGVVRYFDTHYETFEEHSSSMVEEFQGLFGIESVFKAWHRLLVSGL